jgi:hypothetical protein
LAATAITATAAAAAITKPGSSEKLEVELVGGVRSLS